MSLLEVSHLSKQYGSRWAIRDLTFSVETGQICGILGPNGSGKTTTLGILLGCTRPTSGTYGWLDTMGSDVVRTQIGALLEKPTFYPWLQAEANLQLTAVIRGITGRHAIEKALDQVGLLPHRQTLYQKFSLGMKQRLGIAAALLGEPPILVLDEPTNGIDAEGIAHMRALFMDFASRGKTLLVSSHILDEIEKICSHVVILNRGAIVAQGPIQEVLQAEATIEIAASDMDTLQRILTESTLIETCTKAGDVFRILPRDTACTVEEINRMLVSHHIFASHLIRRKQSLEHHFLSLVSSENGQVSV